MSQHMVCDSERRGWMVGFDNPCGGYYATRFLPDEGVGEDGEEADVLIGFGKGVDMDTLISECAENGLVIPGWLVDALEEDKARESRPITPLQRFVQAFGQEFGIG